MRTSDSELDALMVRLAEGDREAFTRVYQKLWNPTLRFCRVFLRSDADASDAAQAAMKKVLERADEYDTSRPALPWALAIAFWECRTILRRAMRRREAPESTVGDAGGFELDLVERDLVRAAMQALGELSAADQEALGAAFWERTASVSGTTLRKRRERALGRLRDAFRKHHGFD